MEVSDGLYITDSVAEEHQRWKQNTLLYVATLAVKAEHITSI